MRNPLWSLLVILPQWAYQIFLELRSMKAEGCEYLKKGWNYVDMTGLSFVLLVFLTTSFSNEVISPGVVRNMAAFGSCFTLLKFLDWLRLFEETAFYVLLVQETLSDIKPFMLVLFTTLMMFGAPLLMLNHSSAPDADIIDSTFNFWFADLLYNQYLLALGEFSTLDNFADN